MPGPRLTFGLRTLLIATVVCATAMGWLVRPYVVQREQIKHLESNGDVLVVVEPLSELERIGLHRLARFFGTPSQVRIQLKSLTTTQVRIRGETMAFYEVEERLSNLYEIVHESWGLGLIIDLDLTALNRSRPAGKHMAGMLLQQTVKDSRFEWGQAISK